MWTFWEGVGSMYVKWYETEIPTWRGFMGVWEAETESASARET